MNSDDKRSLPGSAKDEIAADTPICPEKNVKCPYRSETGCQADICWVASEAGSQAMK